MIWCSMQQSLKELFQTYKDKPGTNKRGTRIYLAPNSESPASHQRIGVFLESKRHRDNDVYLGIGNIFSNLDMMAHGHYKYGILADINANQVGLVDTVVDCLCSRGMDTSPTDFADALRERLPGLIRRYDHFANPAYYDEMVVNEITREGGWLKEPGLFHHLVQIANEGNLVGIPLDLFDEKQSMIVADSVKTAGLTFGAINLTNLTFFLKSDQDFYEQPLRDEDVYRFWQNVGQFCDPLTTVCNASYERSEEMVEPLCGASNILLHVMEYGSFKERRDDHLARRDAYAKGNRDAFTDYYTANSTIMR